MYCSYEHTVFEKNSFHNMITNRNSLTLHILLPENNATISPAALKHFLVLPKIILTDPLIPQSNSASLQLSKIFKHAP